MQHHTITTQTSHERHPAFAEALKCVLGGEGNTSTPACLTRINASKTPKAEPRKRERCRLKAQTIQHPETSAENRDRSRELHKGGVHNSREYRQRVELTISVRGLRAGETLTFQTQFLTQREQRKTLHVLHLFILGEPRCPHNPHASFELRTDLYAVILQPLMGCHLSPFLPHLLI